MTAPSTSSTRARRWVVLALEVLVLVAIFLAVRAWMHRDLAEGPAPAFQARLIGGDPVSLAAYRGQPVLLHFWATWCRVCRLEQGAIQAIDLDWPVLTVALRSGDVASVQRYLSEQGLSWETVVDEHGELARRFGVHGVPTSFVVGPEGDIRFREVGFTTEWGLRARLWLAAR